MQSGEGKTFTARIVASIQRQYHLKARYDRLRDAGMLTVEEMAEVREVSARLRTGVAPPDFSRK